MSTASRETILLILPTLGGGGAERVTINIAKGLSNKGYSVSLFLLFPSSHSSPYNTEGLSVLRQTTGSRFFAKILFALSPLRLIFGLIYLRPVVIMSTLSGTNIFVFLCCLITGNLKRLFVREATTPSRAAIRLGAFKAFLLRIFHGALYKYSRGVVCVSRGVRCDVLRISQVPRDKVRVIYNSFDPVIISEIAPHPHPFFSHSVPVIIGVGRLERSKRFCDLIAAFCILEKRVDARLIIFGQGPERDRLIAMGIEKGLSLKISLPGFEPDIYSALKSATVVCLTSEVEGLPNVLIQSLFVGTPMVATDCSSGPREILEDGLHGDLVDVGDVEGIASALESAVRRPRGIIGAGVLSRFGFDHMIDQYEEFLGLSRSD